MLSWGKLHNMAYLPAELFYGHIFVTSEKKKWSAILYSALPQFHPLSGKIKVTGVARSKDTHPDNLPKAHQNMEDHALAAVTYQNASIAYT